MKEKAKPEGSLISYFSNLVKKEGGINLAQGTPGFFPPPLLLQTLEAAAQNPSLHQYAPGSGNFQLLDLIRLAYTPVAPIEPDNILIVQGATEGIFLSFFYLTTLLARPFAALSFDPVYESYPVLANMFGIPFFYGHLGQNLSVDFWELEKTIEEQNVKVVFIASPGNPLGKVWTREELEKLLALSKQYEFYILFDAVYNEIYFNQPPFNPLSFQDERLFYINSFSKTLGITGWRIGYLITHRDHMKHIREKHDYTGLCAPSVLQSTIASYLANSEFGKDYSQTIRLKCQQSYNYMKGILTPLGFNVVSSEGGYFLWAQLPASIEDAFSFALDLYERKRVAVVPGENFSPWHTNYIRMNIAVDMPIIEETAQRIINFCQQPTHELQIPGGLL